MVRDEFQDGALNVVSQDGEVKEEALLNVCHDDKLSGMDKIGVNWVRSGEVRRESQDGISLKVFQVS
jgi:hypothetical protein